MEFLSKILKFRTAKIILPVFIGGVLGFMYYTFIGCNGSCAITGNPWISTAYGAAMGALFISKPKKELSND